MKGSKTWIINRWIKNIFGLYGWAGTVFAVVLADGAR
jgi:hypothetical protein